MRRHLILLSALGLLALFCSFPSATAAPIPDEERLQVLDEIGAEFEAVVADDTAEGRARLAEQLQSRAEFEDAGLAPDGSVWARFLDGRMVVFPPSPEPPGEANRGSPGLLQPVPASGFPAAHGAESAPSAAIRRSLGRSASGGLPDSDRAVVMTTLGDSFGTGHASIAGWLEDKGYEVSSPPATVEDLKAVDDVGVFYLNTHGGAMPTEDFSGVRDEFSEWLFSLATATLVSAANEARYAEDLTAARLTYVYEEFMTTGTKEWHYGITIHFIRQYMSFSPASLVFIDACGSFDFDMKFGFQGAGASAYLGWTKPISGDVEARYFFDRLLGVNEVRKQDPPNRPFDAGRVLEAMAAAGLDVNRSAGGRLMIHERDGRFSLLTPSLRHLEVDEPGEKLVLMGSFGQEEGEVEIGGAEAALISWSDEEISVRLPSADEAGGWGEVVVRVRDHESNPVPLTLWHGELRYDEASGNYAPVLVATTTFDLYFRADVHPRRERPDEEPVEPVVDFLSSPGSRAEYECAGTESVGMGITFSHSGNGEIPMVLPPQVPDTGFYFEGKVDTVGDRVDLVDVWVDDTEEECLITVTGAPLPVEPMPTGIGGFQCLDILLRSWGLAEAYSVEPGGPLDCLDPGGPTPFPFKAALSWSAFPAEYTPEDDTPG